MCEGILLLVDNHNHTRLAVTTLCAVDPKRVGIVDLNGVCGNLAHRGTRRHRHVARVETGDVAHDGVNRRAGLVKSRLRHGVVACHKLELHHVAGGRRDGTRGVDQRVVGCADSDDLDPLCCTEIVVLAFPYFATLSLQSRFVITYRKPTLPGQRRKLL